MQAGRIVESDTHDGLLDLGGFHAQSWAAQMRVSTELSREPLLARGRREAPVVGR